jgi:hypothetical protein
MFPISIAPIDIRRWDTGLMVERARCLAEIDMKDFLALMGISASTWSRQQRGLGPDHISFDRMTRLPWRFWLWLVVAILRHFTALPEVEDMVALHVVKVVERVLGTDRPDRGGQAVNVVVQKGPSCGDGSPRSSCW